MNIQSPAFIARGSFRGVYRGGLIYTGVLDERETRRKKNNLQKNSKIFIDKNVNARLNLKIYIYYYL